MAEEDDYELVKVRVPYRQVYRLPLPKRKLWREWFSGPVEVRIDKVDPDDAPVAYEVWFLSGKGRRESSYQIRSHDGGLWWPLDGERGLDLVDFANILAEGHPESLALLDPSFEDPIQEQPWPWRPLPEEYRPADHDLNNLVDATVRAQRGASTTMICGDRVFVRAGEPIFYAVPYDPYDGKKLSFMLGVADPMRTCSGNDHFDPGPTRSDREECARRGFAFGIEEIDEAKRALEARGYATVRYEEIDTSLELHRAETAPLLCARQLARHLLAESRKPGPDGARLREQIPILGRAKTEHAGDVCLEALLELCTTRDPVVAFNFLEEVRAAKAILHRVVGLRTSLAPEDDEALARFASDAFS
ncbi:hypothetical protein ACVIW2_006035 [Bradyrhizobium huanghuaihaiense]